MPDLQKEGSWRKHPAYLADAGALFGAPPRLKCQGCAKGDYELFFGHCKTCAASMGIPREVAEPQKFHDALNGGTTVVVVARLPWWHWRRWIG